MWYPWRRASEFVSWRVRELNGILGGQDRLLRSLPLSATTYCMTFSEAVEKLTPLLTEYAVQLKATEDKIRLQGTIVL